MADPITIGSVATNILTGVLKSRTDAATREGLKRIADRFRGLSLPADNILVEACQDSLRRACEVMAGAMDIHVEKPDNWLEAIKYRRDKNGKLKPLLQWWKTDEKTWYQEFLAEIAKQDAFLDFDMQIVIDPEVVTDSVRRSTDQLIADQFHDAFRNWMSRHVQSGKEPAFFAHWLSQGWPIEPGSLHKRVTLYQAWCLFFQDDVKRDEDVFRVLSVEWIAQIIDGIEGISEVTSSEIIKHLEESLGEQRTLLLQLHADVGHFATKIDGLEQSCGAILSLLMRFHRDIGNNHAEVIGALQGISDGITDLQSQSQDQHEALSQQIKRGFSDVHDALPQRTEGRSEETPLGSFDIPPVTPYFEGRKSVLTKIRKHLEAEKTSAIGQAISGLGGIGKTQTALRYAHEYKDHYTIAQWISAESKTTILSDVIRFLKRFNVPHDDTDTADIARALRSWMEKLDKWLVIFDNADTPEVLEPYIPSNPRGHLLVTTRASSLKHIGIPDAMPLECLGIRDSVRLLKNRSGRKSLPKAENQKARELAEKLGGLPLALEQAAAYIATRDVSFADYLAAYDKAPVDRLERSADETYSYPKSVATTWVVNFGAVKEDSSMSADLLRCVAFLAPDRIPFEFLFKGGEELGYTDSEMSPTDVADILEPLTKYSLISRHTRKAETNAFSVHRLVQQVTRDALSEANETEIVSRVTQAMAVAFPEPWEIDNWNLCEMFLPQAVRLCDFAMHLKIYTEEPARLASYAGRYASDRGRYFVAEPLYKQSLEIRRKVLGEEHPDFASSCNNLAMLYKATGRYEEAEPLYKAAMKINRELLGEEHPRFATDCNNLAVLYKATGRYEEAEPLYKQSLEIRRNVLGEEHPDFADSCNNLAMLYQETGRYEEAEPLHRAAMKINRELLGEEHPRFATECNNLAMLYQATGRYEEAEPLYKQSLEIRRKVLGEEHPDFAGSCNNLAILYQATGRYEEAEPLYKAAMKINRELLGEEHPRFATDCNNLAMLYQATGRYEEAEPLYKPSLEIRRKVLGEEHPDFAGSCNNLAMLYQETGRYEEAEPLYKQAVDIFLGVFGSDHPNSRIVISNYLDCLKTSNPDLHAKITSQSDD